MIERFDISNGLGASLQIVLNDSTSGLLVEEIGGMGPVKATIVSSSSAGVDGEEYQSSRREGRDITFRINLEPDYVNETVSDLRDRMYDFFMTKLKVTMRFYRTSGLFVDIAGVVESCEPAIFTPEPALDVSIRCGKPDFIDPQAVTINGSSTSSTVATDLNYRGTVESGILLTLNVNRSINEFTIYNTPPDGLLRQLDFSTPLVAGDILRISTIKGAKYVSLTRGSTTSSLLYAVSPQSSWIEFFRGINKFRLYAVGAAIPYTIQYTTKYGGL